jgi:signal transduction histidine kinase
MIAQGQIRTEEQFQAGETPPDSLILQFIPFLQGMLYVGSDNPLGEDQIDLVKSLAEAFSVAYARYEDFSKLEEAKSRVENTLTDLKAAQNQLIQSEKMASLGELTAGIAHEIQNPLNFVNNFSEVNNELAQELSEEIEKGNMEEVKDIAKDIIENEQKISHHGKRAEAIVKGMLQHSRTNSGTKELIDISVLADEYLRLSYHGLRAKDKSFNADFQLEFDDNLPKIKVVPQDIGRVFLNLINNAFYAVDKKAKAGVEGYRPQVTINLKKLNAQIEINVVDNGYGIPANIKDKIFQPFFTLYYL